MIAKVEEIGKEDEHTLMKNCPIFEWISANIIMDDQDDEEDFKKILNDLRYRHNDNYSRYYVQNKSDDDNDSIGSC